MSWYPCELHCHSVHSDGSFTVGELQNFAKSDGLSLIALTDHNTESGCCELNDGILPAIKGIEWTTYFGHLIVLGSKFFVDWRDARPYNIDKKLSRLKEAGAVVGIAHPLRMGSPIYAGGRWEFEVNDWSKVDYIEILHGDLRAFSTENDKAPVFWSSLLDRGYKIAAAYGRGLKGANNGGHYGLTYIDIDGEITEESALLAIQNGRTVVSAGFGFSMSVVTGGKEYRIGDTVPCGQAVFNFNIDLHQREDKLHDEQLHFNSIKIFTNDGKIAAEIPFGTTSVAVNLEKNHWYRAELWGVIDGNKKHMAITSPIYCEY